MNDVWQMIRDERAGFGELLPALTETQWSMPSLCKGWTVRDVVAHEIGSYERSTIDMTKDVVKSGFRFQKYIDRQLNDIRRASTRDLIARYNTTIERRTRPPTPLSFVLSEALIHNEDARRPLDVVSSVPVATTTVVANFYRKAGFARLWRKKSPGIKLVATDSDWTIGDGNEAYGPLLSLVLLISGRKDALRDLRGPGAEALQATQLR